MPRNHNIKPSNSESELLGKIAQNFVTIGN